MKKSKYLNYITEDHLQWAIVLFCQFIFVGLVCARALASIGMAGIIIFSLLHYGIGGSLKTYFRAKELLVLSLFFWIVFFAGIYSEDKKDWLNWVRIKVPYLVLPLAFAPLKQLNTRKLVVIVYGFMLTFFISASIILCRYYLHYDSMNESFSRGSAIPIPYSHIRYTLMFAFSFFCSLYLLEKKYYLFHKAEWLWQVFFAVFAVAALHVLTVRSGLLALYLGLLYLAIRWIFLEKKFLLGILVILLIATLPFAAYQYVPSINKKFGYMRYDLEQYQQGKINNYSDAMRILSVRIGIDIWKQSPWIGVGPGDLEKECNKIYASDYPQIIESNRRVPHNQFVWMLATTGIIGLAIFLFAFFFPLFYKGLYKYWPVTVLHIILFSSFFTEDTFEEQVGTGFYLIFLLLWMNYFKRE